MNKNIDAIADEKEFLAGKTIRERISHRSELTQEILSHEPSFIEKWALLIFLCLLLVLVGSSWFFRYPDIITARATLTAINGPKEIIAREGGHLTRLFVNNGDSVHKNEVIGWIENSADHQEVLDLGKQLDSSIDWLSTGQVERASGLFNRHYKDLGSIQQSYQEFITAWQLFNDYMVNGFYLRKQNMLQTDLGRLAAAKETIQTQKDLTAQDIKMAEESFKMNKVLADEKVISQEELREATSKFVNKQMAVSQVEASLLSNAAETSDKLKELDQLEHNFSQQQEIFREALTSLKSLVDDWKKDYIIWSPIDGKAFFAIPLQESRFITQGKLIGYVVPDDGRYYVDATLSQNSFGKIDTGLKVQIRFDAYPYQEMGYVEGTLNYVSDVGTDSGFLATIRLDHGLMTNDKKNLPYRSGLKADALIITRNTRLLERLYYNMTKFSSVKSK